MEREPAAEQRDLHLLTLAGALACVQRRRQPGEEQQGSGVVGCLDLAVQRQAIGLSAEGVQESGPCLGHHVHPGKLRLWTHVPERGPRCRR